MSHRTFNYLAFEKVAVPLLEKGTIGFDAKELVLNTDNILLTDGDENYALFEYAGAGSYYGHYFFSKARGRKALDLGKKMIKTMFNQELNTAIILGATPIENRKALWMSRQLGFSYIQEVNTKAGPMSICMLTKKEFEANE